MIEKISPKNLSILIKTGKLPNFGSIKKLKIVDVRDDDFTTGKIKNSVHISSESLLDSHLMHKLVQDTLNFDLVVFHCYLSQQRGPSAAMMYENELNELAHRSSGLPIIAVLEGGWKKWFELYGTDPELSEEIR